MGVVSVRASINPFKGLLVLTKVVIVEGYYETIDHGIL